MVATLPNGNPGAFRASSAPAAVPVVQPRCDGPGRQGTAGSGQPVVRLGRDASGVQQVLSEADSREAGVPLPEGELGEWDHERDTLWGTRYFVLAVTRELLPRSIWKLIGDKLQVDAIARQALSEANTARRIAATQAAEIDGLKALIRSLEQLIHNHIPGV